MSSEEEIAGPLGAVKSQLQELDDLPVDQHAQILESVHRALESALSTIDGL